LQILSLQAAFEPAEKRILALKGNLHIDFAGTPFYIPPMFRYVAIVVFFWSTVAFAQSPVFYTRPVPELVETLLQGPMYPQADSVRRHIPLISAYLEYNALRRPAWFTPLSDRQALFFERARAHMLGGMFKAVVMADLARSESGVLPVTESAIADLDSAAFYLRKIEPYANGPFLRVSLADRNMALVMSDSLKNVLSEIKKTHSFYPAMVFSPWFIIKEVVTAQPDSLRSADTPSVSNWLYKGAVKVQQRNRPVVLGGN
jgi:hypothetical protein